MIFRSLLMIVSSCFVVFSANAQPADPLFSDSQALAITLTGPFGIIDKERDKERNYEGSLSYIDSSNTEVKLDARLSVRGNWRLKRANCGHAQLWVDLKRGQVNGTLFENQNRLKLVVQCGKRARQAEWIMKEKMAYDLFAVISPLSFDARLVEVRYLDSESESQERTQLGFFIEHQTRLAERFELNKNELNGISVANLDSRQSNLIALFMFMIGNTDYSLSLGPPEDECCHNAKVFSDDTATFFPAPYDFDSSGLVDAAYAPAPSEAMKIRNNKQRRYRGYCQNSSSLDEEIAYMLSLEEEIMAVASAPSGLSERTSRNVVRYVEGFFEILKDDRQVERQIINRCR